MRLLLLFTLICHTISFAQTEEVFFSMFGPGAMVEKDNILYVAEFSGGTVKRLDLTSEDIVPESFVEGLMNPTALLLDGDTLYISEREANRVQKIVITDPAPVPELVVDGLMAPYGLLKVGDELFIAEREADRISKINLLHEEPILEDVIAWGISEPFDIFLQDDQLFITERSETASQVSVVDLTDPELLPEVIVSELDRPFQFLYQAPNLFFTEFGGEQLWKIDLTDLSYEMAHENLIGEPYGIFEYEDDIYVSMYALGTIVKLDLENFLSVEKLTSSTFEVYPNPATNQLNISTENPVSNEMNVLILNSAGALMSEMVMPNGQTQINIDQLENGQYWLVIEGKGVQPFVKE